MTTSSSTPANPRPFGRQPVALRGLAESIQGQLERELRAAGELDSAALFVKAFWLRAADAVTGYGWPDYAHAYIWVAPVMMNPKRCEVIETFVVRMRGVIQTGRGGDDPAKRNTARPFVYAVVDLKARQS